MLPPKALIGVDADAAACLLYFLSDTHFTALAARDSAAILPPPLTERASDSNASVTSASSIPPVPVAMITAHLPIPTIRQ